MALFNSHAYPLATPVTNLERKGSMARRAENGVPRLKTRRAARLNTSDTAERGRRSLGCQVNGGAFLGANESEQVGVDLVRMCGGHSVRQAGIGLKRSVL